MNDNSASASNRLKTRPKGSRAASMRFKRIWWARVMEVAADMAFTAPQPCSVQFLRASSIGSKGSGPFGDTCPQRVL